MTFCFYIQMVNSIRLSMDCFLEEGRGDNY